MNLTNNSSQNMNSIKIDISDARTPQPNQDEPPYKVTICM